VKYIGWPGSTKWFTYWIGSLVKGGGSKKWSSLKEFEKDCKKELPNENAEGVADIAEAAKKLQKEKAKDFHKKLFPDPANADNDAVVIRVRHRVVSAKLSPSKVGGQLNWGFVFRQKGGGAPRGEQIANRMKWTTMDKTLFEKFQETGTLEDAYELDVKYFFKSNEEGATWVQEKKTSYPGKKHLLTVGFIGQNAVPFNTCGDENGGSFVECGSTVTNRAQPEEGVSHVLEREAARQSAKWTQKDSAVASVDIAGFGAEVDAGVLETAEKQTAVPPTAAKRKHPSLQPLSKK
jgi:hypothetical protein